MRLFWLDLQMFLIMFSEFEAYTLNNCAVSLLFLSFFNSLVSTDFLSDVTHDEVLLFLPTILERVIETTIKKD